MNKLKVAVERIPEIKEIIEKWVGITLDERLEALNTLLDLAEQVIALQGKMPEKRDISKSLEPAYAFGLNRGIDLCTLAFIGMLGEKKESCGHSCCDEAKVYNQFRAEILKKMGVDNAKL